MNCTASHWPQFGWDEYCQCFWSDDKALSPDSSHDSFPNTISASGSDGANLTAIHNKEFSEIDNEQNDKTKPKGFSKAIRSVLRRWLHDHAGNPYPTSVDLDHLVDSTGLSKRQISVWLSNARCRRKPRLAQVIDPNINTNHPSIFPNSQGNTDQVDDVSKLFEQLNPFERWRANLNVTCEAAAPSAIASAVAEFNSDLHSPPNRSSKHPSSLYNSESEASRSLLDTESVWDDSLPSSTTISTSPESGLAERPTKRVKLPSNVSRSDASSATSTSGHSGSIQRRRCRSNFGKARSSEQTSNKFHCTFCNARTFKTKYDWQRHETSQHMTTENWTCCLFGGTARLAEGKACTFCGSANPDPEHVESHHYSVCQDKDLMYRTFYRKDHLTQHLKLVHDATFQPWMNDWKASCSDIQSTCGFCAEPLSTWDLRASHLASHFKDGMTMEQWHGPRGLLPFPPRTF